MKQGLLLTLKELIKLGIICTKRRKKRKTSSQLTTMSSMGKGIPLSIQSRRYNEFLSASQPPTQMPYTDNLRLRDEQSNLNTRLIEYKNQLENEKSLLENRQKVIMDDIDYSKIAVGNEIQKLNTRLNRNSNWEDDNTDVAPTFGSDSFKPQVGGSFRQTESGVRWPTESAVWRRLPTESVEPVQKEKKKTQQSAEPIVKPKKKGRKPRYLSEDEEDESVHAYL